MHDVFDIAKFFIKSDVIDCPNSYDGNMKLQKLLLFANLISLARVGKPLFSDPILAFENGCVVEAVRLRYRNDYHTLKTDSRNFNPVFTESEYWILNATKDIFGHIPARELSVVNHQFDFWKNALSRSRNSNGFRDKDYAAILQEEVSLELPKIKEMLSSYENSHSYCLSSEIINDVTFHYDPRSFTMTDEMLNELQEFAMQCDERTYSVYKDGGMLVIY